MRFSAPSDGMNKPGPVCLHVRILLWCINAFPEYICQSCTAVCNIAHDEFDRSTENASLKQEVGCTNESQFDEKSDCSAYLISAPPAAAVTTWTQACRPA